MPKPPALPKLLTNKIYKTGQTRGADDDVIYQNRVARNSTVLIPYSNWDFCHKAPDNSGLFENGFIVLIKPQEYFETPKFEEELTSRGLILGVNSLLFYETRAQWRKFNPENMSMDFATARQGPLGGSYVARVPSLTSEYSEKIIKGYTSSSLKGAGIRVYEYASRKTIADCRVQLELLFWHCENSRAVAKFSGMTESDIDLRIHYNKEMASTLHLDDWERLKRDRIINEDGSTICPLCLNPCSQ